ncbi:MAG: 30S ribosomal protein S4 [Candidatus Thermoplasmatota archaeon]|jgi:small subunit ribosomal protein S4|nr:30S ribosomal protein S4 [Candidatus Thermoplasmatota archaeon]MCL5790424.1 30S ribosomal protein S4 [Candidatus Thermoplasmatota archaeon]
MGDPKFPKKRYSTPRHPWEKERIDEERALVVKYGLKNKKELWRSQAMLDSVRSQARNLQAKIRSNDQVALKQLNLLLARLNRYRITSENSSLDDILSLNIENILERRLQTLVYRKNLAVTPKQARQMITHGHVILNGRRVTVPGLIVEGLEEDSISYVQNSPFTDDTHPVRRLLAGISEGEEPEPAEAAEEKEGTKNE